MRSGWLTLCLALPLLGGCRNDPPPEERVDGWAIARAALTGGEHCLAGRAEYCLDDPAFVDAAIKPRLEELYGGEMPLRRVHVDAITRAAAQRYRRSMMQPENLARVEELVRERYENPRVTTGQDVVSVDMGVVPGRLAGASATLGLKLVSSDLVDESGWLRSELERVLLAFAKRYPDKDVVRVAVWVPTARGLDRVVYRYLRTERRLVISTEAESRTTRRVAGLEALSDPHFSLRPADLSACRVARVPAPPEQDPPSVCPPDVDPAAPTDVMAGPTR